MNDIDQYGQFTVDFWFSNNTPEASEEHDAAYWKQKYLDLRSLFIMTTGLAGETGEVMEKVKKYVRDGNLNLEDLKKELGDVAYYWARLSRRFDTEPSDVLDTNVKKLVSRRARGVMRGSGDNR